MFEAHRRARHAKRLRQESDKGFIGTAIDRRRCNADLEGLAVQADDFAFFGSWLRMNADQPALGNLPAPVGQVSAQKAIAMTTIIWLSTMMAICATRRIRIGDRSMLPMVGMNRLKKA